MDLIKLWRSVGIENAAVGIKIPNDLQACGSGNPPAPFSKCSCRTSGYLSFKKGSRDLLATWQEKRPLPKKTVIRSQKKEEYLNPGPL